jgi:hypothetical protein
MPTGQTVVGIGGDHPGGLRHLPRNARALGHLGHVDITIDLTPRAHPWLNGGRLHDLEFDY